MNPPEWERLAQGRYLSLESYRRDGTPVRTPLWFAPPKGETVPLYCYSSADSFKVKRLRRDPRCRIAACDLRGNVTGVWLDAQAAFVTGDEAVRANALLDRRYWPWRQLLGLFVRLRPGAGRAAFAIRPA